MRKRLALARLLILIIMLMACKFASQVVANNTPQATPQPAVVDNRTLARWKIKHIVVIMQENRSSDHHSGTCPGADGIPC